jgi:hypothetical protein
MLETCKVIDRKAQRGVEVYLYSFLTSALEEGGWSAPRPGRFTPGKTRYPLYMRLGGPQGWSGRVRKISHPPGLFFPEYLY